MKNKIENNFSIITREKIIEYFKSYFSEKEYVYVSWLGCSDANNETDIYSDIDLFFCVEDKKIFKVFDEIKAKLLELGELDFESSLKGGRMASNEI